QHVLVREHVDRDHGRAALDGAHAVLGEWREVEIAFAPEAIEELRDPSSMIDHLFHGPRAYSDCFSSVTSSAMISGSPSPIGSAGVHFGLRMRTPGGRGGGGGASSAAIATRSPCTSPLLGRSQRSHASIWSNSSAS